MEINIEIPNYSPNEGIKYKWEKNFEIKVEIDKNTVLISANKAGLMSLANHLLNLSQDKIPSGYHMHFDEINSLEENSAELTIQKN
jgi:hypothetical protein